MVAYSSCQTGVHRLPKTLRRKRLRSSGRRSQTGDSSQKARFSLLRCMCLVRELHYNLIKCYASTGYFKVTWLYRQTSISGSFHLEPFFNSSSASCSSRTTCTVNHCISLFTNPLLHHVTQGFRSSQDSLLSSRTNIQLACIVLPLAPLSRSRRICRCSFCNTYSQA